MYVVAPNGVVSGVCSSLNNEINGSSFVLVSGVCVVPFDPEERILCNGIHAHSAVPYSTVYR